MPQENEAAVSWVSLMGLSEVHAVTVVIRARLVTGWKTLQPWETDGMTEIGRRVIDILDLIPGINGIDVHRYDLTVGIAPGWSKEAVGNEIVEVLRPLIEESP